MLVQIFSVAPFLIGQPGHGKAYKLGVYNEPDSVDFHSKRLAKSIHVDLSSSINH